MFATVSILCGGFRGKWPLHDQVRIELQLRNAFAILAQLNEYFDNFGFNYIRCGSSSYKSIRQLLFDFGLARLNLQRFGIQIVL